MASEPSFSCQEPESHFIFLQNPKQSVEKMSFGFSILGVV